MQFRILGPVEATDAGRPGRVACAGSRCASSGSCSCAAANRWPPTAPSTRSGARRFRRNPANALQVVVSRLRAAVGAEAIAWQRRRLRARARRARGGRCRSLRPPGRRGRGRAGSRRPAAAAEALHGAMALWRGPALHELRYESFAVGEVARLEEMRVACLGARIEADLALGRHEQVLGELTALVAEHPLRESLRAPARAGAGEQRAPGRGARGRARRRAGRWPTTSASALARARRAARRRGGRAGAAGAPPGGLRRGRRALRRERSGRSTRRCSRR